MTQAFTELFILILSLVTIAASISRSMTAAGQLTNAEDAIYEQVHEEYRQANSVVVLRQLTKLSGPELYRTLMTREVPYIIVLEKVTVDEAFEPMMYNHIGTGKPFSGKDDEKNELKKLITDYGGSTFSMIEIESYKKTGIFLLNYDIKEDYRINLED